MSDDENWSDLSPGRAESLRAAAEELVADPTRVLAAVEVAQAQRVKQQVHWQQEAREEFAEARARERMDESDARYDERVDLSALWDEEPTKPTVCAMTTGECLFYEGERNVIYGPSEAGKTWLAIHAVIQEVKAGRPAFYIDYENGRHGFKDRLKAFGVTREEAEKFVWYFDADGGTPPSPEKVASLAVPFTEQGGRLVVVDTTTPGMRSLGLNPLGEVDVETFYVLAGDPWVRAGCCWLTVDHTPGADATKHYGNQQKKSGVTGTSVNVIENVKFSRRTAGFSDVFIAKDRHGGGPEAANEKRQVARLHVRPGVTLGEDVGVLELEPVDASALRSEEDARRAVDAMARAAVVDGVQRRVYAWVRKYDTDGDGLPRTWITKGGSRSGRAVPAVRDRGVKDVDLWKHVNEWLADPAEALTFGPDGKSLTLPAGEPVDRETLETV